MSDSESMDTTPDNSSINRSGGDETVEGPAVECMDTTHEPDPLTPSAPPLDQRHFDEQNKAPISATSVVIAHVHFKKREGKRKLLTDLQIALQTWINQHPVHELKSKECKIKSLSADDEAVIEIVPASVIPVLLKQEKAEVFSKDGLMEATIMFSNPGTETQCSPVTGSTVPPQAIHNVNSEISEVNISSAINLNDVNDPLVTDGITMENVFWKLMSCSFKKKIEGIEKRFGVTLESVSPAGTTRVMAKSRKGFTAMESHALRALLNLYQKVVTSAMTCLLKAPDLAQEVERHLQAIDPPLPVLTEQIYTSWRLIGLPENLLPAVAQLEKLVGSVFKEEDKEQIGYSGGNTSSVGAASEEEEDTAGAKDDQKRTSEASTSENDTAVGAIEDGGETADAGDASVGGGASAGSEEETTCCICMDTFTDKKTLKCGHEFCAECLSQLLESIGPVCPICKDVFGELVGDQPDGKMTHAKRGYHLSGYRGCGTIEIYYKIYGGYQTEKHPQPGTYFSGINRTAYLPDNDEGREVLALLERAFEQKLIFTVGSSRTSGYSNVVTWNDIHHKTSASGGPENYGYPDPDYLARVREELKAKGVE